MLVEASFLVGICNSRLEVHAQRAASNPSRFGRVVSEIAGILIVSAVSLDEINRAAITIQSYLPSGSTGSACVEKVQNRGFAVVYRRQKWSFAISQHGCCAKHAGRGFREARAWHCFDHSGLSSAKDPPTLPELGLLTSRAEAALGLGDPCWNVKNSVDDDWIAALSRRNGQVALSRFPEEK
ncbi:unnamed protein product [Cylicocyclus nassatus]|uniref:Uncharacterized protein n=1 Tax=Cylicocyclus nassatus TaxID=53992 RepID=A0AA36GRU5_CYLNA|nr:unnamed protein product [Cylicocyclus nassatus]